MIGIAFRQLRAAIVGTAALTGVLVAVLAVDGGMARALSSRMVQACGTADDGNCRFLQTQLWGMYVTIAPYLGYLTITTVLVATFWGAPLVSREVESGTAALAWSQSVSRQRWFASRLIVSSAVVGVLGLALGFAVTWWLASFAAAPQAGENVLDTFNIHGLILPALWISGMLIGALIGTLVPHVLPAMAITAVVTFIGAIAFNLSGRLSSTIPVGELQVLTHQALQALPVLVVGAATGLVALRQVKQVRI